MKRRRRLVAMATACWPRRCGPRGGGAEAGGAGGPARRPGAEDPEQPLLHRHGARARRRRPSAWASNLTVQAAEREVDVDKQMQIIENLIQTGVKVLIVTPVRIEGDRARHRQGQPGRDPRGGGGHARGPAGGQGRGHHTSTPTSAPTTTRAGRSRAATSSRPPAARPTSACWRASPATRRATSGCAGSRTRSRTRRGSRSSPPRPRTGSATRASPSSRTCWRRIPRSTPCSPRNDMMALGAVEAIAAKGKTGKIKVVGYDAVEDAKKAIADGHHRGLRRAVPVGDGPRGRRERGQAPQGPVRARGAARAHRPRHQGQAGGRGQPGGKQ